MRLNLATKKSFNPSATLRVKAERSRGFNIQIARLILKIKNLIGQIQSKILFRFSKPKKILIKSSEYKKFDGSLKMTISCYTKERELFQIYLQNLKHEGKIYFGLHISNRALVTCLIGNQEVHLVDAADGGYALAAKQIKQQVLEN